MKTPTFTIRTLGCKVNQYEGQAIRENLVRMGFAEVSSGEADLAIVNSCTVTGQADVKTRRMIRRLKKENPSSTLVVTGCKVVLDDDVKALLEMPEVDQIVVNSEKMQLPLFLGMFYELEGGADTAKEGITSFSGHTRAFLKIQDGCDQSCAYCKVSLVRGPSKSRRKEAIMEELVRLVSAGYREIVLTGICIGSWKGPEGEDLADLVRAVDKVEGDFRVRISSTEPNHITDELIKAVAGSKKICHHFHIPLQSGSDDVLGRMARRYNAFQFSDIVRRIREAMPLAGITMDIIAGFPGETSEDHKKTLELIRELKPSRLHVFKYSDRKGAPSAEMEDKVPSTSAAIRVEELIKEGNRLREEFAQKFLSEDVEVLVEGTDRDGYLEGYTGEYVRVKMPDKDLSEGEIVTLQFPSHLLK